MSSSLPSTFSTTTLPSTPALLAMVFMGTLIAALMICTPTFWSKLAIDPSSSVSALDALSSAVPPPETIPSSTAALVALSASTTRSFFSPTSTSEAPPTLSTATPPESFASLSCIFSLS